MSRLHNLLRSPAAQLFLDPAWPPVDGALQAKELAKVAYGH